MLAIHPNGNGSRIDAGGIVRNQRSKITRFSILMGCAFWSVLGVFAATAGMAAPLDLSDPTPRWIEVRFEVSPAEEPGSLDRVWSAPRRARVEPVAASGAMRIRIPADQVETHLRSTGSDPIKGTFSEFVWMLDPVTGHVVSANLSGEVRERLQLGPIATAARIEISVEMTTETRPIGFIESHGILGIRTNRVCHPAQHTRNCVGVEPVRFDPSRGYVNAVGSVRAAHPLAQIKAFSPLGEVEFREIGPAIVETVVSGPSLGEAVCSPLGDRSCPADQGGES